MIHMNVETQSFTVTETDVWEALKLGEEQKDSKVLLR